MNDAVAGLLARLRREIRDREVPLDSKEQRVVQLARTSGALEALLTLGLISREEYVEEHASFCKLLGVSPTAEG